MKNKDLKENEPVPTEDQRSAAGDLEEYIRQGEPEKKEKVYLWRTAIGLQDTDGLRPSSYLIETARQNIEGKITIDEAKERIDRYYKERPVKDGTDRTEEADKVSARITEILSERAFTFSSTEYIGIHGRLFQGIYKFAGKIRDYNITKTEWVLGGKTVNFASAGSISAALEHDFDREKRFDYRTVGLSEAIRHIIGFVSDIWQIHAFGEGNTRTTAVFVIKYLRSFGFDVGNDIFAENARYFRNALVRANYNDIRNGIVATKEYLERFFGNMLLGENNELRSRSLHVSFKNVVSERTKVQKQDAGDTGCTIDEHAILKFFRENPRATQKEAAVHINRSERTAKAITVALQEKGLLERRNGRRNGYWAVGPE
ncbi:MAG: Fic family protein [Methanomassiliicoccaceae archaeon]|nr:Fic family protein [Methanomassiliicoccaceae archaeon]